MAKAPKTDQVTTKVWLTNPSAVAALADGNFTAGYYNLAEGDMEDYGWILVKEISFLVERPDPADLVAGAMNQINLKRKELREELNKKLDALDEAASKLQSLTYVKNAT